MKPLLLIILLAFVMSVTSSAQSLVLNSHFGNNGVVTTNIDYDQASQAGPSAAQPDGKIIIAGFPITRVLPNGVPDSSFNGNGTFLLPLYE